MPFAMLHRNDASPALMPLAGLEVHQVWDAEFMARLQDRSIDDMRDRLDSGHRAYVAWRHEEPAAWGWVATASAHIGELGANFQIPAGERYLWNFVTLPAHRGLGIYPRLLQSIVRAESSEAERFWIAYAPENHASGGGIARAGFARIAEMSFDPAGRPALYALAPGGAVESSRVLGLRVSNEALAPCWRCVRAGRGAMSCAAGACRCDYQKPESGCALTA